MIDGYLNNSNTNEYTKLFVSVGLPNKYKTDDEKFTHIINEAVQTVLNEKLINYPEGFIEIKLEKY